MTTEAECDDLRNRQREAGRRSYAKHRDKRLARARIWRANNAGKVREIKKRWNANNPEKVKEYRRRSAPPKPRSLEESRSIHRKRLYGLTPEMFDAMLVSQDHSCKICSKKPKVNKTLTVDHCHETGKIRGLLCTICNVAIAQLGDNEAGLMRALKYLKGPDI